MRLGDLAQAQSLPAIAKDGFAVQIQGAAADALAF